MISKIRSLLIRASKSNPQISKEELSNKVYEIIKATQFYSGDELKDIKEEIQDRLSNYRARWIVNVA